MVTLGRGEHGAGVREDSRASDGVVVKATLTAQTAPPNSPWLLAEADLQIGG
jgi:hypothetical protein